MISEAVRAGLMSQSEFAIIQQYFAQSAAAFPRANIVLGIGDDAAQIQPDPDHVLTMSMDVLVADVHFPATAEPVDIANRALAVNLSDLAAMGAEPLCFTLGLTLPMSNAFWLESFSQGLVSLAQEFNCPLVGGDLSQGPLQIAIQVQGQQQQSIKRSGARPGDAIYVTGTLGDAVIALASFGIETHLGPDFSIDEGELSSEDKAFLHRAFYAPEPRISFAIQAASLITAGLDISDGLLGDLGHLCIASAVGAVLDAPALPLSALARRCLTDDQQLSAALAGGDDYELCFTASPAHEHELQAIATNCGMTLSRIGEIREGAGIQCLGGDGKVLALPVDAFQHFQEQL